jgi:hypothetical protein
MQNKIINEIATYIKEKIMDANFTNSLKILEIGPGTGLLTNKYINCINRINENNCKYRLFCEIDLIEINSENNLFLENVIKNNQNQKMTINLYNENFIAKNLEKKSYDLILSSFTNHHIQYTEVQLFYDKISDLLCSKGKFIFGEEYVPHFDLNNDAERIRSLVIYHNRIIFEATSNMLFSNNEIEKNCFLKLTELEHISLQKGINKDGEYKVSEKQAKSSMKEAKLNLVICNKIGPKDDDVDWGGVYFCVAITE